MKLLIGLLLLQFVFEVNAKTSSEVYIKEGTYSPFFRDKNEPDVKVGKFWVDKYPVTNQEFLKFVRLNPEWSRTNRKDIFAGSGYLKHWLSDFVVHSHQLKVPVSNVSWFAARKYCEFYKKRLLTIAEWEYVSDAQNPKALELILKWYGSTDQKLQSVSRGQTNGYGLVGMHGLIWEWVEDFSSAIVSGDSRSSNEANGALFCGSGALKAKDPSQYATFMRFAYRSSLKANSTGLNLGFRCVKDAE